MTAGAADAPEAPPSPSPPLPGGGRARDVVARQHHHAVTDRLAANVLVVEWAVAVVLGVPLGARAVATALLGGLVINGAALALTLRRPGWTGTRHANAAALVMWAPVLQWVSRGHIADHHHAFATLAGLALYRDWRVLRTALIVLCAQLVLRGALWPAQELAAAGRAGWWFVEHGAWLVGETAILMIGSLRSERDERDAAKREARLERTQAIIERHVHERTLELQESAERYRDLVENMEAVTFEVDMIGRRMRYVSPQAYKLLDCGEEALTELERSTFDIVITDMRMPMISGSEVLEAAARTSPHARRVILSGSDCEAVVAHVDVLLVKPCGAATVRATIERLLAERATTPRAVP